MAGASRRFHAPWRSAVTALASREIPAETAWVMRPLRLSGHGYRADEVTLHKYVVASVPHAHSIDDDWDTDRKNVLAAHIFRSHG